MTEPKRATQSALLDLLNDITACIAQDDSMEGSISWRWSEIPGEYDVAGGFRVGNRNGQGGFVMIGPPLMDDELDSL